MRSERRHSGRVDGWQQVDHNEQLINDGQGSTIAADLSCLKFTDTEEVTSIDIVHTPPAPPHQ